MTKLAERECKACTGETEPLKGDALLEMASELPSGWEVMHQHHLERTYKFGDWKEAVAFTNKVADLAEEANHHPDIQLSYGEVGITLFTHKIGGLTENDFVLADRIEDAHN